MARILLAENEESIRTALVDMLIDYGHEVEAVTDGVEALEAFNARKADLVLLDVGMPRMNGFTVCEEIRKRFRTIPILFLSAKTGEANRVRGLLTGGDDYIDKTVGEAELMARIDVALRRVDAFGAKPGAGEAGGRVEADGQSPQSGDRKNPDVFQFESWLISESRLEMKGGGETVPLFSDEVRLLRLFAAHPGEIVRREMMEDCLWGNDVPTPEALRQRMHRLIERLGADGSAIENVRGVGYIYRPKKLHITDVGKTAWNLV